MKEKEIHIGHRDRMKKRFLEHGLDTFDELHTLELILFYAISRRDVNPLAHRLLDTFGSLAAVLDAPAEELMKVEGVGENTAVFLKLLPQIGRRYEISRSAKIRLDSSKKAGEYLMPRFLTESGEAVYMVCLDAKCEVLYCGCIGRGSLQETGVDLRKIVELALRYNAGSVILAHNHPSGIALPSGADVETTRRLSEALRVVHVRLADHIIVAADDFVSMADSGII